MTDLYRRGEVWLASLSPTQGSEQSGIQPVILFQSDVVSRFSTTVVTIPLTTSLRRAALRWAMKGRLVRSPFRSSLTSVIAAIGHRKLESVNY